MGGNLANSLNQFLSFSPLYAASNPAESVFWPGCAAMKLGSGIISRTYRALRQANPSLGFSSWCCAKPTLCVGRGAQIQRRKAQINGYFSRMGIKRLYTLCPNCQSTLMKITGAEVFPAWPLLAEYAKIHAMQTNGFAPVYILHDPCEARADAASRQAARDILDARNVEYVEFKNCGSATRCCGRKNMLILTDPAASRKMLRERLEEAGSLPVATYCESCVEAFRGASHKAVHLLEILFDEPAPRGAMNRVKNARNLTKAAI